MTNYQKIKYLKKEIKQTRKALQTEEKKLYQFEKSIFQNPNWGLLNMPSVAENNCKTIWNYEEKIKTLQNKLKTLEKNLSFLKPKKKFYLLIWDKITKIFKDFFKEGKL